MKNYRIVNVLGKTVAHIEASSTLRAIQINNRSYKIKPKEGDYFAILDENINAFKKNIIKLN